MVKIFVAVSAIALAGCRESSRRPDSSGLQSAAMNPNRRLHGGRVARANHCCLLALRDTSADRLE